MAVVQTGTWVVISGGVGGARFAYGLDRVLPAGSLTIIGNTGDDFTHLGLRICPDLDTLMYTLAGVENPETGWGCREETWNFMEALGCLGGDTWFRLGDRDLATHVERTRQLAQGGRLSEVTAAICTCLGIESRIVPMSDDPVSTRVITTAGVLAFQDYFVRRRAEPTVTGFNYDGSTTATPGRAALDALHDRELRGIFIAPSNPWLSIGPILAIPALREALSGAAVPVVAVSPIIGGKALKGPAAKIMAELGLPVTATGIAEHYGRAIQGMIVDETDTGEIPTIARTGLQVAATATVMRTAADRCNLAGFALEFASRLRAR